MTGKYFVDTNILLYSVDLKAGVKREIARALLDDRQAEPLKVVSTQVLQEFYAVATRKLRVDRARIRQAMDSMCDLEVVQVDVPLIREAIDCSVLNNISFWDALIVSAARKAACSVLWTEDLNHGQVINGVRIENPFVGPKAVRETKRVYRARRPIRLKK